MSVYMVFILVAFTAANIPWLTERFMCVFTLNKNAWWRWFEWLLLYFLAGVLAWALEYKLTGVLQVQDWEFYVTTLCLFMVFALPGFIFHYDLKKMLLKPKNIS